MADKTVSHVQQDPTSQSQQNSAGARPAQDAGRETAQTAVHSATAQARKMAEEHFARVAALQAEVARLEQQGVEQLLTAVDESARLARAGLQWYLNVSAQSRQAAMDAARRTSALFTPAV